MNITNAINDFYYHMALYELQMMNNGDYYHGMSYNSLLYVNVIAQMENCTVSKMADALHVTRSAVTLKVNEMVKQGFVVKVQSEEDRRVFYIRLSPQLEQIGGIYDAVFDEISHRLAATYTEEQLSLFGDILHTISGYEWRKMKHE